MERLTERYKDPIVNTVLIKECGDKLCKNICDDIEYDCSKCELEKALEKLAYYEDLEEQGLLVRLPCKVGTVVYRIESRGWTKSSICGESFSEDCEYCEEKNCDSHLKYEIYSQEMISQDWIFGNRNGFGRTIFLTREEAEKKLEEMKNE